MYDEEHSGRLRVRRLLIEVIAQKSYSTKVAANASVE